MRKVLALAGVFVLVGSVCYGQEVTPDLNAGSKALVFQVNLFNTAVATVNDDVTAGIGFKYYLSQPNAIRVVVEIAKSNATIPSNPGPGQVGADGSNDTSAFGVSGVLE